MKSIPRSPTSDGKRRFLDAFRNSDGRMATNEEEAIARIKILMEHGRLVLDKLSPLAHEALFSDQALRDRFLAAKSECAAFILSIDIRRSTELMLKARSAELFGEFMAGLCDDLKGVICDNYGIVDKFTGDGLLASFPEFFSGPDAGYRAISAAQEAHLVFAKRYKQHRHSFSTILADVGLGIGIDYGNVRFMRIAGDLTVVGAPVVYATRMSNAPAGKSILNQPAYEKIVSEYHAFCSLSETELDIKHEGRVLAYEVRLKKRSFTPAAPPWLPTKKGSKKKRTT
ncbi:MAG: adenylate/guanylate cyclase domain-containing protein [Chthoniobacter sp.]|nr:adenylate/guanylate cyclase domain-containing protein [Chthoniobacter sp.]